MALGLFLPQALPTLPRLIPSLRSAAHKPIQPLSLRLFPTGQILNGRSARCLRSFALLQ